MSFTMNSSYARTFLYNAFGMIQEYDIAGHFYTLGAYLNCFGNGLVLVTNVGRIQYPSTALLMLLCSLECINGSLHIMLLKMTSIQGHFPQEFWLCELDTFANNVCCGGSLMTLAAIAMERYLSARYLNSRSWKVIYVWIICIILMSFGLASFPYLVGDPRKFVALEEHLHGCSNNWAGVDLGSQLGTYACLAVIVISTQMVGICYFLVYRLFSTASLEKKKKNLKAQKTILLRCSVITGVLIGLWTPYLIKVLINLVTRQPVSYTFSFFSVHLIMVNSVLNPVMLILFDNRIRANTLGWLSFTFNAGNSGSQTSAKRSRQSSDFCEENNSEPSSAIHVDTVLL